MERRLAAILAADVAGYSRLMGIDDEGTHKDLKAHCQQLVEPKIQQHRGRIIKNTGDGFLAEFSSVLDADRCATEIQQGMALRNAKMADDRRIDFRIGVHQGDIITDSGDIFGDGVNVATRLEGIADPGGICVSARVQCAMQKQMSALGQKRTSGHTRQTQGGVIPGSRLFAMLQHTSQNISAPETDDATARKYARGP